MGAKEKILEYLMAHLNEWTHNEDLRKLSGANDTPRILRALRQEGWAIEVRGDGYSRLTVRNWRAISGQGWLIARQKVRTKNWRRPSGSAYFSYHVEV